MASAKSKKSVKQKVRGRPSTARASASTVDAPVDAKRTPVDAKRPPVDGFVNEGQRLLLAVPGSTSEIAAALDVSKQVVSCWRRGEKSPSAPARTRMKELYAIDPTAWDRAAGVPTAPAAAPRVAPAPPATIDGRRAKAPTLDEVHALLDWLAAQRNDTKLKMSERRWFADEEIKALRLRDHLEEKLALRDERTVKEHPLWIRMKGDIIAALRPHPDAARSVRDVLVALRDSLAAEGPQASG